MMNQVKWIWIFVMSMAFNAMAGQIQVDFQGLKALGAAARYEVWLVHSGNYTSLGVFGISEGVLTNQQSFYVNDSQLDHASHLMVSVEPFPDIDASPSNSRFLAGGVTGDMFQLTVGHAEGLGFDISGISGGFSLLTAGGLADNPYSEICFARLPHPLVTPAVYSSGLNLPDLPDGWVYEGWVKNQINGVSESTGKFADVNGPDQTPSSSQPGSGYSQCNKLFPGELYENPVVELTDNRQAMVSIQPDLGSPITFEFLTLLEKQIEVPVYNNDNYQLLQDMEVNTALPRGSVTITRGGTQQVPSFSIWGMLLLILGVLVFGRHYRLS